MDTNDLKSTFEAYSNKLDEKNDKYERIYKVNRDITSRSKKVIFMLQRLPGMDSKEQENLLQDSSRELKLLESKYFRTIATELSTVDPMRYANAYTGGIQEYIEAALFHHYISEKNVLSFDEIQKRLCFVDETIPDQDQEIKVAMKQKEYILGLADFTGELMRYAVKSISVGDFENPAHICELLRRFNIGFISLPRVQPHPKELFNKVNVFKSSLEKVENACYSLELLKLEFPSDAIALCQDLDSFL